MQISRRHTPTGMKKLPKRTVEIYFVLYLASIVTLLAIANERNIKEQQLSEALAVLSRPDFNVSAKQVGLTYQFFPTGVKPDSSLVLQRDTTNVVVARGSFDRADFSIVSVIDTISGEILPAERLMLEQRSRDSAFFQWSPDTINGNHVYRVTIRATADPAPPSELKDEAIRKEVASVLAERGSTMNANVVFTINTYALGLQAPEENPPTMMLNVPFNISPQKDVVGAFVNVPWSNSIIVSGADVRSQLARKISSSSGAVKVNITSATSFDVSGLFSQAGTQQVDIEGSRLMDNEKVTASFRVNVQEMPQPDFPKSLYAGEEYTFDVRTKDIPSEQLSIELGVGPVVKISRAMNQAVVTFAPDRANIGEQVTLASFLNGNQVGQTQMPIVTLPYPEVLSIEQDKDGFVVTTKSYGHYGNQPNRARLLVREAPSSVGEPEELTDQYKYDNLTKAHIQKWHLMRHGSGDVVLDVYAIDSRGLAFKSTDVTRHF